MLSTSILTICVCSAGLISITIFILCCTFPMIRHSLFPVLFKLKGMTKLMEIFEIMLGLEHICNSINILNIFGEKSTSKAPIFIFYKYIFFGPKIFIIGDGKFANYILKNTNDIKYMRNKWLTSIKLHDSVIGGGSGKQWKKRRNVFKHPMLAYNKNIFKTKCSKIINDYFIKWQRNTSYTSGFSLVKELISMVIEIHCQLLFGFGIKQLIGSNGEYFADEDDFVQQMMDHINIISHFYGKDDNEYNGKMSQFAAKHFIPSLLNQFNTNTNDTNDNNGFVSLLCKKLVADHTLSVDEIIGFYSNILFGLTPAFALFWILMMYVNSDHKQQMKCKTDSLFLRAFITESMRLYAPINTLLSRKSLRNDRFGNINIPQNSEMIISMGFIQNLECNYKNANKCIPERWMNENSANTDKLKVDLPDRVSHVLLPFGSGSTHCLGRRIAMDEITIFLKEFMQNNYQFEIINKKNFNLYDENVSHWQRFKVLSYSWPATDCKVKLVCDAD